MGEVSRRRLQHDFLSRLELLAQLRVQRVQLHIPPPAHRGALRDARAIRRALVSTAAPDRIQTRPCQGRRPAVPCRLGGPDQAAALAGLGHLVPQPEHHPGGGGGIGFCSRANQRERRRIPGRGATYRAADGPSVLRAPLGRDAAPGSAARGQRCSHGGGRPDARGVVSAASISIGIVRVASRAAERSGGSRGSRAGEGPLGRARARSSPSFFADGAGPRRTAPS
eukprot:scaffold439_cov415-Prasinococcus_capsulatus_cf.AAC.5